MTPAKPIDRAKIAGILKLAFEKFNEGLKLLHEVDTLNGGGAGIGAKMDAIAEGFSKAWESRYAEPYAWTQNTRDRPAMKRLLHELTVEEIVRRAWVYIADEDSFYVQRRHPFLIFVGSINRHIDHRPEVRAGATDAQRTRRMLDEAKRPR